VRIDPLGIDGAWIIEPQRLTDERGWFARLVDVDLFAARGIDPTVVQESVAWNEKAGTLRGIHLQEGDAAEGKLIRCTSGAAYDVIVDLRADSATFRQWRAVTLTAENHLTVWAPPGTAHGYLTLEAGTELVYRMNRPYVPEAGAGVRWDDPVLGIDWPSAPAVVSDRDRAWPLLTAG